jgi:hypothetical protein
MKCSPVRFAWSLALTLSVLLGASAALLVEPAEAQTVRGTVSATGEEPRPLEGAIVRLLTADSQHVDMVLTSRSGHFVLVAPRAGRYMLEVEHVLYVSVRTGAFAVPVGGTVVRELAVARRDDEVDAPRPDQSEASRTTGSVRQGSKSTSPSTPTPSGPWGPAGSPHQLWRASTGPAAVFLSPTPMVP